jgi:trans-aconitate methyltransferase
VAEVSIDPAVWEAGCAKDGVRNRFVVPTIVDIVNRARFSRLLDVGCGTGYVSRRVSGLVPAQVSFTLLDRDPGMVDFAAATFPAGIDATFIAAELQDFVLCSTDAFDVCFSAYAVLEFPEIELSLSSLRGLVPIGKIILFIPDTNEDILSHYLLHDVKKYRSSVDHVLKRVDRFTRSEQIYIARQPLEYVRPLLDAETVLAEVRSFATTRGRRHYALIFDRLTGDRRSD